MIKYPSKPATFGTLIKTAQEAAIEIMEEVVKMDDVLPISKNLLLLQDCLDRLARFETSPQPILSEELWQAIKARMGREQRMRPEPAQHLPYWSNPDPYNRGPSSHEVIDPTSTSGRRTVY